MAREIVLKKPIEKLIFQLKNQIEFIAFCGRADAISYG
jgi:hypothetical protein